MIHSKVTQIIDSVIFQIPFSYSEERGRETENFNTVIKKKKTTKDNTVGTITKKEKSDPID